MELNFSHHLIVSVNRRREQQQYGNNQEHPQQQICTSLCASHSGLLASFESNEASGGPTLQRAETKGDERNWGRRHRGSEYADCSPREQECRGRRLLSSALKTPEYFRKSVSEKFENEGRMRDFRTALNLGKAGLCQNRKEWATPAFTSRATCPDYFA